MHINTLPSLLPQCHQTMVAGNSRPRRNSTTGNGHLQRYEISG